MERLQNTIVAIAPVLSASLAGASSTRQIASVSGRPISPGNMAFGTTQVVQGRALNDIGMDMRTHAALGSLGLTFATVGLPVYTDFLAQDFVLRPFSLSSSREIKTMSLNEALNTADLLQGPNLLITLYHLDKDFTDAKIEESFQALANREGLLVDHDREQMSKFEEFRQWVYDILSKFDERVASVFKFMPDEVSSWSRFYFIQELKNKLKSRFDEKRLALQAKIYCIVYREASRTTPRGQTNASGGRDVGIQSVQV